MTAPPDRTVRPRRSALFMPGSNARALEKGRSLPCDVIIMDLEDGVAPDAKDEARVRLAAAAGDPAYGPREVMVRVNGIGTPWFAADVGAMAKSGAAALLVPKTDGAATVRETAARMDRAGAPADLAIWCMIETASGVLNAREIAAVHPRLAGFILGAADLSKDLRALHTADRMPIMTATQLCILAARAHGLAVLDSPHFDLADEDGFRRACRQARELGFDGKTLIHPKQIAGANAAFGPSADELAWARRIIDAHRAAIAAGKGVTLVDDKLIEGLHVIEAERLIALAAAIDVRDRVGNPAG